MLRKAIFLAVALCAAAVAGASQVHDSLWKDFVNPPDAAKPWCYYKNDFDSTIPHLGFSNLDNIELHGLGLSINCLGHRVAPYTNRDAKEIAKPPTVVPGALPAGRSVNPLKMGLSRGPKLFYPPVAVRLKSWTSWGDTLAGLKEASAQTRVTAAGGAMGAMTLFSYVN